MSHLADLAVQRILPARLWEKEEEELKPRSCLTPVAVVGVVVATSIAPVPTEPSGDQNVRKGITSTTEQAPPESQGASAARTDVLKRAEDALMALDANALVSLYAEEFVFEDTSAGVRITDKIALRSYFDGLFSWPNCSFSGASYFGLGQRGAGQWTWEGSSRPSGERFSVRGASLFKIEGDRITEEIIFYDPRPAYR